MKKQISTVLIAAVVLSTAVQGFAAEPGRIVGRGEQRVNNAELLTNDFITIADGGHHSLGIRQDGSIVAWGDNGDSQCNVPSPNTGFVAIAAGGGHSLGLKSDGSIVAWGYNNNGQCDVPSPNTGFVAVAGGGNHSLGLKQDGSIVAWGSNGIGHTITRSDFFTFSGC